MTSPNDAYEEGRVAAAKHVNYDDVFNPYVKDSAPYDAFVLGFNDVKEENDGRPSESNQDF
jgi:hypothetical protein